MYVLAYLGVICDQGCILNRVSESKHIQERNQNQILPNYNIQDHNSTKTLPSVRPKLNTSIALSIR